MPQRGIKTYCRPKIAPRAHFLDAEVYNAPRCYPMSLLLSVVFGLLGLSACGFSIEPAYDIYNIIIIRRRIRHYVMSYLSSGMAFYTVF